LKDNNELMDRNVEISYEDAVKELAGIENLELDIQQKRSY